MAPTWQPGSESKERARLLAHERSDVGKTGKITAPRPSPGNCACDCHLSVEQQFHGPFTSGERRLSVGFGTMLHQPQTCPSPDWNPALRFFCVQSAVRHPAHAEHRASPQIVERRDDVNLVFGRVEHGRVCPLRNRLAGGCRSSWWCQTSVVPVVASPPAMGVISDSGVPFGSVPAPALSENRGCMATPPRFIEVSVACAAKLLLRRCCVPNSSTRTVTAVS